jgi:hypothetical protein
MRILDGFSIKERPIFWLRLVGVGYACNWFLARAGRELGLRTEAYPVREMLAATHDEFVLSHLDDYPGRFETVLETAL